MPKNKELEKDVVQNYEENIDRQDLLDKENVENKNTQTNKKKQNISKSKNSTNVNEETVIEKIKSFLEKIVALQEEAKNEKNEENNSKESENQVPKVEKPKYLLEYYDLPYRYNETVVKVLAQTPKKIFVYWDISDNDRERYINAFGEDFYYKTYPVLLLYNEDKKYVREIPVNDFANSWYIDIQDPKNKYIIQLGRKFNNTQNINYEKVEEQHIILMTDYLPMADSNMMEVPNDHVLLEDLPRYITFRNVKTNEEYVKTIGELKNSLGKNYNIKDFYNEYYKDEVSDGIFDMANPSSKINSSTFK